MTLDSIDWQKVLFARELNRFALGKLRPSWNCAIVRARVFRNHGAELMLSGLRPFLAFVALQAEIVLSDYDDAMTITAGDADLEVVWLDFSRYTAISDSQLLAWLSEHLSALRSQSSGHIVVANSPDRDERARGLNEFLAAWTRSTPQSAVLDLHSIAAALGARSTDHVRAGLTGTRFSDAMCLEAARQFAFVTLPSHLVRRVKAIAVDLDHTIYQGVLGEDGPMGVILTDEHRALQEQLVALHKRGLLIVVVSRNVMEDARELFTRRADFPLQAEHIVDWRVAWSPKAELLLAAAQNLRLGTESFLLIDDNVGEIAAIHASLPATPFIFAGNSPAQTMRALDLFPGVAGGHLDATDAIRHKDLQVNAQRQALAAAQPNPAEYLQSLGVVLELARDPASELTRLTELSQKTNQFNLALSRFKPLDVARYLSDADSGVVMVWMRDRLSDSGSVAAVFGHREDDVFVLDEICISCRALGRHLEDHLIGEAIDGLLRSLPCETIRFRYREGSRNAPARAWLERQVGWTLADSSGEVDIIWRSHPLATGRVGGPLTIGWRTL